MQGNSPSASKSSSPRSLSSASTPKRSTSHSNVSSDNVAQSQTKTSRITSLSNTPRKTVAQSPRTQSHPQTAQAIAPTQAPSGSAVAAFLADDEEVDEIAASNLTGGGF